MLNELNLSGLQTNMLFFAAAVRILDKTQQSEQVTSGSVNGDLLRTFKEDISGNCFAQHFQQQVIKLVQANNLLLPTTIKHVVWIWTDRVNEFILILLLSAFILQPAALQLQDSVWFLINHWLVQRYKLKPSSCVARPDHDKTGRLNKTPKQA